MKLEATSFTLTLITMYQATQRQRCKTRSSFRCVEKLIFLWRERKKTNKCNNQMFIINFCVNMFRASSCPSLGEQRPCYCVWCTALVLLDVVGSGCGGAALLLLNSVSTCFGHYYAHLQASKDRVTAYGVLLWFCWMWSVAFVGRCVVINNFCLNMFRASLCPSSGEQRPCYCIWCTALVLLDVVGSGCEALRCRMWALLASYNAAPHNSIWRCLFLTVHSQ